MTCENSISRDITRDSAIRQATSRVRKTIVRELHSRYPDISPTHLNLLGVLGVGFTSLVAGSKREGIDNEGFFTGLPVVLMFGFSAMLDAFDGELARYLADERDQSIDFLKGQLYDVASDRLQELLMALARATSARNREDRFGGIVAYTVAVTNTLPSLARAYSESSGQAVSETGTGLLGLLGTRMGRMTSGILATVYPEIYGFPIQTAIDGLTAIANTKTTIDRMNVGNRISESYQPLSQATVEQAKARMKLLSGLAAIAFVASAAVYHVTDQS